MTPLEEKINNDLAQKRIDDNLNLPKHIAKKLDVNVKEFVSNNKLYENPFSTPTKLHDNSL
jgi:hypothetical protein